MGERCERIKDVKGLRNDRKMSIEAYSYDGYCSFARVWHKKKILGAWFNYRTKYYFKASNETHTDILFPSTPEIYTDSYVYFPGYAMYGDMPGGKKALAVKIWNRGVGESSACFYHSRIIR